MSPPFLDCTGCKHYGSRTKSCDYMLHTGHHRACPVENCTKREDGPNVWDGQSLMPLPDPNTFYKELGSAARDVNKLTKGARP